MTSANQAGRDGADKPVVLITGASAGIGQAIAHRFADGGYRIVAVARGPERLEALAGVLSEKTEVATFAGDVAVPGVADQVVKLAMERFGRLDCLVNNAGAGKWAPVHLTDDATLDEVIDLSLKGTFRFCRAALGVMKPGSSIVTIGSTFGIVGGLDGGAYCTVKAGLIGLTQTMAAQYGAGGIRSNLVAPSVIKTDMTRDYWDTPYFQRLNQEMTPSDRDGACEDVSSITFYLASREAGFINGQTIAVDGGWTTTRYLCPPALLGERVPYKPAT